MKNPWLTIIGIGENGLHYLADVSQKRLEKADIIIGPPRHLRLLELSGGNVLEWPVPFSEGLNQLDRHKEKRVVVLVSGDPFWYRLWFRTFDTAGKGKGSFNFGQRYQFAKLSGFRCPTEYQKVL